MLLQPLVVVVVVVVVEGFVVEEFVEGFVVDIVEKEYLMQKKVDFDMKEQLVKKVKDKLVFDQKEVVYNVKDSYDSYLFLIL